MEAVLSSNVSQKDRSSINPESKPYGPDKAELPPIFLPPALNKMNRLAISLAKVPRGSTKAVELVAHAIKRGTDVMVLPTHCEAFRSICRPRVHIPASLAC